MSEPDAPPVEQRSADATTGPLTITVAPAPAAPVFTASTPPATATAGTPYSYTFTASGVPTPTFAVSSGTLPAGLTLTSAGVLAGTPTAPGRCIFTVTASNGVAPDATTGPLTITVVPVAAPQPPATAGTPLPQATPAVPVSYNASFTG